MLNMLKFFACVVAVGIILSVVAVLTVLVAVYICGCLLEWSEKNFQMKEKQMNEYINKRDLLGYADNFSLGLTRKDIERFPTADVVEVVRCKDCKYYKTIYESYKSLPDYYPTENDKHNGFCNHPDCLDGKIYEDNFCSKGKRRGTEK